MMEWIQNERSTRYGVKTFYILQSPQAQLPTKYSTTATREQLIPTKLQPLLQLQLLVVAVVDVVFVEQTSQLAGL